MQKMDVLLKEEKVENYRFVESISKSTGELKIRFANGILRSYLEKNGFIRKEIIVEGRVVEEWPEVDPRYYVETFDFRELKKKY